MDNNTASPHEEGAIADKIEQYADTILRASGSALRHYTMQGTREVERADPMLTEQMKADDVKSVWAVSVQLRRPDSKFVMLLGMGETEHDAFGKAMLSAEPEDVFLGKCSTYMDIAGWHSSLVDRAVALAKAFVEIAPDATSEQPQ